MKASLDQSGAKYAGMVEQIQKKLDFIALGFQKLRTHRWDGSSYF
jgi:hypothetical protein